MAKKSDTTGEDLSFNSIQAQLQDLRNVQQMVDQNTMQGQQMFLGQITNQRPLSRLGVDVGQLGYSPSLSQFVQVPTLSGYISPYVENPNQAGKIGAMMGIEQGYDMGNNALSSFVKANPALDQDILARNEAITGYNKGLESIAKSYDSKKMGNARKKYNETIGLVKDYANDEKLAAMYGNYQSRVQFQKHLQDQVEEGKLANDTGVALMRAYDNMYQGVGEKNELGTYNKYNWKNTQADPDVSGRINKALSGINASSFGSQYEGGRVEMTDTGTFHITDKSGAKISEISSDKVMKTIYPILQNDPQIHAWFDQNAMANSYGRGLTGEEAQQEFINQRKQQWNALGANAGKVVYKDEDYSGGHDETFSGQSAGQAKNELDAMNKPIRLTYNKLEPGSDNIQDIDLTKIDHSDDAVNTFAKENGYELAPNVFGTPTGYIKNGTIVGAEEIKKQMGSMSDYDKVKTMAKNNPILAKVLSETENNHKYTNENDYKGKAGFGNIFGSIDAKSQDQKAVAEKTIKAYKDYQVATNDRINNVIGIQDENLQNQYKNFILSSDNNRKIIVNGKETTIEKYLTDGSKSGSNVKDVKEMAELLKVNGIDIYNGNITGKIGNDVVRFEMANEQLQEVGVFKALKTALQTQQNQRATINVNDMDMPIEIIPTTQIVNGKQIVKFAPQQDIILHDGKVLRKGHPYDFTDEIANTILNKTTTFGNINISLGNTSSGNNTKIRIGGE